MTQFTLPVIDPGVNTGTELSNWLNQWRPALESAHQGASRPSYAVPGMIWVNNANPSEWIVNVYDGTHDVPVLKFDPATGIPDAPGGDVVGPGTSVAGNAAIFADATGKLLGQKAVQSNTTDTTAAALMINGAWGLGNVASPLLANIDDLNTRSGLYRIESAGTTGTKPPGTTVGVLIHVNYSAANIIRQIYLQISSSVAETYQVYTRMAMAGVWNDWNEFPLADLYGVGATSLPILSTLNDFNLKGGLYKADGTTAGTKPGSTNGVVLVMPYTGNSVVRQVYMEVNGSADLVSVYTRQGRAGTTWGAWVPVYTDSGWITPTLASGTTQGSTPLRYRKIGNLVELAGAVVSSNALDQDVFTLPAGYRPVANHSFFQGAVGNNLARVPFAWQVTTAGLVNIVWDGGAPTSALTSPRTYWLTQTYFVG